MPLPGHIIPHYPLTCALSTAGVHTILLVFDEFVVHVTSSLEQSCSRFFLYSLHLKVFRSRVQKSDHHVLSLVPRTICRRRRPCRTDEIEPTSRSRHTAVGSHARRSSQICLDPSPDYPVQERDSDMDVMIVLINGSSACSGGVRASQAHTDIEASKSQTHRKQPPQLNT